MNNYGIAISNIERHKYDFPTIDCKFQNNERSAVWLRGFELNLDLANVNYAPELLFDWEAPYSHMRGRKRDGILHVHARNFGWGSAKNLKINLNHRELRELYHGNDLTFQGEIESGASVEVFRLGSPPTERTYRDMHEALLETGQSEKTRGIRTRLGGTLSWICKDINDQTHERAYADVSGPDHDLYLNINGFTAYPPRGGGGGSGGGSAFTVASIINPDLGPQRRTYKLARVIPPGGVERFHVMVGATKSCTLRFSFSFLLDREIREETSHFEFEIWNPINRRFHDNYTDGDELERAFDSGHEPISRELNRKLSRILGILKEKDVTSPADYWLFDSSRR